jgi:hypothetical protein
MKKIWTLFLAACVMLILIFSSFPSSATVLTSTQGTDVSQQAPRFRFQLTLNTVGRATR